MIADLMLYGHLSTVRMAISAKCQILIHANRLFVEYYNPLV